ncbi:hypothetical protein KFL_002300140 [Klebsormidium nitens]|uniref:Uncharacterized protein n=1 Tax=Klebsormidium nitens TaxID=105231 RepID=A0A1Y1I5W1_KLENI|nr:hypothetical protein KFL_002300140 [Klebsormidium nitens]|eukprot:GAQ85342.1 hypothetical protein KFL_002300140 [Klebsormidium nitens]
MLRSAARLCGPGTKGKEHCIRIIQELAAYKGGAGFERILTGVLWEVQLEGDSSEDYVKTLIEYNMSCQALASLTESNVAVERCLKALAKNKRQVAQHIYKRLSENALKAARGYKRGSEDGPSFEMMVVAPLECLTNFVRVSRSFRDAIENSLAEISMPESLGFFLSAEFLDALSKKDAFAVQYLFSSIAASLALYPDSQIWALDKGLLKMLAAAVG